MTTNAETELATTAEAIDDWLAQQEKNPDGSHGPGGEWFMVNVWTKASGCRCITDASCRLVDDERGVGYRTIVGEGSSNGKGVRVVFVSAIVRAVGVKGGQKVKSCVSCTREITYPELADGEPERCSECSDVDQPSEQLSAPSGPRVPALSTPAPAAGGGTAGNFSIDPENLRAELRLAANLARKHGPAAGYGYLRGVIGYLIDEAEGVPVGICQCPTCNAVHSEGS